MEITVNVVLSADPELITHLATLVECVQDVLHVSNSQLAAAEPEKPKRRKKKTEETAPEPEPEPAPAPEPEPVKEEPAPEPVAIVPFQDKVKEIVMTKPIGTSKKVVELLKGYNVTKVRDVPEDKQAEFIAKVEAL
jgi:outer membrane biosynthesis protein TonB